MKHIFLRLFLLLFLSSNLRASDPCGPSTLLQLSTAQLDEFDATRWVTLTPEQRRVLQRRTGIAPSRVQVEYDCPDGERSELGYNIALKTSITKIKVLHQFLLSDEDAQKKRVANRKMIAASGPGSTKDNPSFAIDSEGNLWRWISRSDFESYINRDSKNIGIVCLQLPNSASVKNTVASDDTLRQATRFCKDHGVPDVISDR